MLGLCWSLRFSSQKVCFIVCLDPPWFTPEMIHKPGSGFECGSRSSQFTHFETDWLVFSGIFGLFSFRSPKAGLSESVSPSLLSSPCLLENRGKLKWYFCHFSWKHLVFSGCPVCHFNVDSVPRGGKLLKSSFDCNSVEDQMKIRPGDSVQSPQVEVCFW